MAYHKLNMHGISGTILNWIRNFLFKRQQMVKVDNIYYGATNVTNGVPQSSILGPILSIIYINNLPNCVSSTCIIFADDTKLHNFKSKSIVFQKIHFNVGLICGRCNLIEKIQGSSLWCKQSLD